MDVIKVKVKAEGGVHAALIRHRWSLRHGPPRKRSRRHKGRKARHSRTGLYIELPEGYEAQVRPRSGLAFKHGVTVLNTPGTIDSDYRGEIRVILINLGEEDFTIEPGDRIAQMVFAPVTKAELEIAAELNETERAAGGFGSTGKK